MITNKNLFLFSALGLSCPLHLMGNKKSSVPPEKPNIVFFLTEDISPRFYQLFSVDGEGVKTPHLQELYNNSVIFNNAYSNAPVSSAARTTLITGCYAPSFAGSFHRNHIPSPMPEGLQMFPSYLRQKGYFTANAAKTDYNVVLDKNAWDILHGRMGDWRKRKDKDQPFFFQRNYLMTHESQLQFSLKTYRNKKTRNNPDEIKIHPYLPNTPLMRYTYATLYDRIEDSDNELGKLVDMLKEDGVLDNTFIFYFGDNGGCVPGTKGYTNDVGIRVPLMVYIPKLWREKMKMPLHTKSEQFVSFMDLGPTALSLAGIKTPKEMDGKPIMGKYKKESKEILGYGDRFDELYAFNRSIRVGNFRYARNYQPYHTQSLYAFYRYKQLAFKEWKELFKEGDLNAVQSRFFNNFAPEELYDLKNDPYEEHNLANDAAYAETLKEMREKLCDYVVKKADLGFFPETIIHEEGMPHLKVWGHENHKRIKRYQEIANLQLKNFEEAKLVLQEALLSEDEVEQWWALSTCAYFGEKAQVFQLSAAQLKHADRSYICSRAIVALAHMGVRPDKDYIFDLLKNCKTGEESLLILNDYVHLIEAQLATAVPLKESDVIKKCKQIDWRVNYINQNVTH